MQRSYKMRGGALDDLMETIKSSLNLENENIDQIVFVFNNFPEKVALRYSNTLEKMALTYITDITEYYTLEELKSHMKDLIYVAIVYPRTKEDSKVLDPAKLNVIKQIIMEQAGGSSSRRRAPQKTARVTPVKTSRTYKGKDGVERVLYKRGVDFYVKKKSEKTGKFTYRKVKV
jgi:hypothetical protein